jgi:hypothetical protein
MLPIPLLLLGAALATPPNATLDSLDEALERLTDAEQVASFRVTTTARYADTDGDDAHTEVVVTQLSWGADGEQVSERLSHVKDGEPISAEELAEREREREEKKEDGDKEVSMSLAAPAGDDLSRYVYGPTTQQGAVSLARFEPAPGEPEAEDLSTGQLAWDSASGQPLWITFVPVDKPFLVKSLTTKVEIGQTGGMLHTVRVHSYGVGGPPLLRKQFDMDMRFHDVTWR